MARKRRPNLILADGASAQRSDRYDEQCRPSHQTEGRGKAPPHLGHAGGSSPSNFGKRDVPAVSDPRVEQNSYLTDILPDYILACQSLMPGILLGAVPWRRAQTLLLDGSRSCAFYHDASKAKTGPAQLPKARSERSSRNKLRGDKGGRVSHTEADRFEDIRPEKNAQLYGQAEHGQASALKERYRKDEYKASRKVKTTGKEYSDANTAAVRDYVEQIEDDGVYESDALKDLPLGGSAQGNRVEDGAPAKFGSFRIGGEGGAALGSKSLSNSLLRRLAILDDQKMQQSARKEERGEGKESGPGLLSLATTVNSRPLLSTAKHNPFSSLYMPVYNDGGSLQSQVDFDMLDNDPNFKSHFQQMTEELGKRHSTKRDFVAIVIDADQQLFLPELLEMGVEGAKIALKMIRDNVNADLKTKLNLEDIRLNCFCNFRGLYSFITKGKVATPIHFVQFCDTTRESAPFNLFTGSGSSDQAADVKVKAFLTEYVFDPHCLRVYLGGLGDHGYKPELDSLRALGKLHRIQLLNVPEYTQQSKFYEDYLQRKVEWGARVFVASAGQIGAPGKSLVKGEMLAERAV